MKIHHCSFVFNIVAGIIIITIIINKILHHQPTCCISQRCVQYEYSKVCSIYCH